MRVEVRVIPNANRFAIRLENGVLKVWVESKPEKGKANRELVQKLSEIFGSAELVSGQKSRRKFVEVQGDEEYLRRKIESIESVGKHS
ncbi:MAG: DUF167 domain-containing protein [Candidatus Anstonellales archaeon]